MNYFPHLYLAPRLGELARRASRADQGDLLQLMADCNAARAEANGAAAVAHEILAWLALQSPDLFDGLHEKIDPILANHQLLATLLAAAIAERRRELGFDVTSKPLLH
ncbi:MAG: hypothetical protein Q4A06_06270 [Cardiobacteriaceae bacterium]|nr:hypothetical protein [Cardiobacteriaceae bacterium]